MFNAWKRRRKMGATTAVSHHDETGNDDIGTKKRSLFHLFRRVRWRRKTKTNNLRPAAIEEVSPEKDGTMPAPPKDNLDELRTRREGMKEPPKEFLDEKTIMHLFSGAPQFSAERMDGRIKASASFPWNFNLQTRDVSDSNQIPTAAYSGCTLHRHLPGTGVTANKDAMAYDIGVFEQPSMLSSSGKEPGTVGMAFFAQEPDADILHVGTAAEPEGMDVYDSFSNFELLESQPERLGIRKFDFSSVAERLVELSAIYESTTQGQRACKVLDNSYSGKLYSSLFGKVLTPPKHDNTLSDPTGLKIQIEALLRISNLKRVWYDFSNVEWRIRVGQLLFSDERHDLADSNITEPEDGLSERDVILLQLLLACELYTRLEAIVASSTEVVNSELKLTVKEIATFRELESRKTKWDLVLAKRFLDNVDAKTYVRPKFVTQSEKSLTKTLLGITQQESLVQIDELDIAFEPKRQELQLEGLFHFANSLGWPDGDSLQEHMRAALALGTNGQELASPSIYATPLSTPGTMTPRSFRSDRESGYFAGAGSSSPEMTPRSFQLQVPSRLDLKASTDFTEVATARPTIGGWLSRSYLTGLILPGEAICHLLMSTLLENDAQSIAALGENANLYGGFVYKDRSYWSKSCVLGRVLACHDGSKECMGWVATSIVPDGYSDGWLDVHSLPISLKRMVVDNGAFSARTDFLAGKEVNATKLSDLTLPQDKEPTQGVELAFKALRLEPNTPTTAVRSQSEEILTATLDFAMRQGDSGPADIHDLPLSYLVQFVSAYPCTPPHISALKHAGTGEDEHKDWTLVTPAHPLHKAYQYTQLHVTELLDPQLDIDQGHATQVIVVDARGDLVLELLGRAWCSSIGENALIAKVGTTCFACAVREAAGLGIKIVLRIGEV